MREMTVDGLSASARTRLLAFLEAAVPKMEHALAENEQSDTFDDDARSAAAARYEDDTGGRLGPECVHALDPRPSTRTKADAGSSRDERFWRDLVPTGLSWNRSGYSIAVSYGRFDVMGWCDSPGALCVWNLRREDVDPRKPDSIFETDSCLQCVAWHPVDPAVVAAGSFDGEVHVWDVRGDADGDGDGDGKENVLGKRSNDGFVARSAVSDASHREPVVSVAWLRSARAAGTRAGRGATRTHDVCSFGSDGRVLVWDFSKAEIQREDAEDPSERSKTDPTVRRVPFPSFGYETRPPADAGRERGFVRGIAAASFIPTARASGDSSSANTANTVTTVTTGTVQNAHVRAREGSPSSTSSFLLGCDGGAVLECLMRHGAEAGAAAFARECAAGSVPAMRSPATAEYEPHRGAAHGVCAHPSEPGLFLSCGADGALKLFARRARRSPVARLEPRAGALFCAAWSPARPALAACGTSGGTVVLYDLLEAFSSIDSIDGTGTNDERSRGLGASFLGGLASLAPTAELRGCACGTPTQALAFNPAMPEYLAAADGTAVRVWDLGTRFAVPAAHEGAAVRRLAAGEEGPPG
jgi:WD40 repeat protein